MSDSQELKMSKYDEIKTGIHEDKLVIYLAAPFFNEKQLDSVAKVKATLESIDGVVVFSPSEDGTLCKPNDPQEIREKAFEQNIVSIKHCNAVVAIIDPDPVFKMDAGTMFEIGGAFFEGIPVIGMSFEPTSKMNLMLAQAFHCYCQDLDLLHEFVTKLREVNKAIYAKTSEYEKEKYEIQNLLKTNKTHFENEANRLVKDARKLDEDYHSPETAVKGLEELMTYRQKTIFKNEIE